MTQSIELKEVHKRIQNSIPNESDIFDKDTVDMIKKEIDKKSLQIGDTVSNFSLPDQLSKSVELSKLLEDGPLVINFYRGSWCPYCNLELNNLKKILPQIKDLGASLIAISPQRPDQSMDTAEKNSLEFSVLSDDENKVAKEFGLVYTVSKHVQDIYKSFGIDLPNINSTGNFDLPVPGTFIVNRDGIIEDLFVNADYKKRMEPSRILEVLEGLK